MLSVLFYLLVVRLPWLAISAGRIFHCAARFIQGFGHNEVLS